MTDAKSTRRHTIAVLGLLALSAGLPKCALAGAVKTVKPVSFADVRVDEGLWAKRLEISRTVTIPEGVKRLGFEMIGQDVVAEQFRPSMDIGNVVFCAVDSMQARQLITTCLQPQGPLSANSAKMSFSQVLYSQRVMKK